MKKLRLTRLMALAIVFAVASAFTTAGSNTGNAAKNRFANLWYANTAHNSGNPLTAGQVNSGVSYTDANIAQTGFLDTHCPDASTICLAKFAAGPTGSQLAFKAGRYQ